MDAVLGDGTSSAEAKYAPYVSDALEVVKLKFVGDAKDIEDAKEYPVEFAYQHFDQSYLEVKHDGLITEVDSSIEPDNILQLVRNQYPIGQTDTLVTKLALFQNLCERQTEFRPFGKKVDSLELNEKSFEVYRADYGDRVQGFDYFLGRVQTVTLFFIEAAEYTDPQDERFLYYFVYQTKPAMQLAGYVIMCKFYAYPDMERARFAHVLVMPPFRRSGFGAKFLQSVFNDLRNDPKVMDITAETPADAFIFTRDQLDCVFCKTLPEFAPEELKKKYGREWEDRVRKVSKMGRMQCRRVYEILRYYYVQTCSPEDEKAFEAEVKRRLELPFKRSSRDSSRMSKALSQQEMAIVGTNEDPEERARQVDALYEQLLTEFDKVLDRLTHYEPQLFPAQVQHLSE